LTSGIDHWKPRNGQINGGTLAFAIPFAFAFLVVIPEGDLLLPLLFALVFQSAVALVFPHFIFRVFSPKNACQAPKQPNHRRINNIRVAY
jgi:hypothetical protein